MLVVKTLETSIDLLDPNEIYSTDIEGLIKKHLVNRYVGKCYQSLLITGIKQIIKRSLINITNNRLDAGGFIHVMFKVEGIIFLDGEIINGCKVIDIRGKNIMLEQKYASIMITDIHESKTKTKNVQQVLNIGDVIPVIAHKMRYTPSRSSITVVGSVYVPQANPNTLYNITLPLQPVEMDKVKNMLQKIEEKEADNKKIADKKLYGFFTNLLYPYKVNQKYESTIAAKYKLQPLKLSYEDLSKLDGVAIIPSEDHKSNKRIFYGKHVQAGEDLCNMVVDNTAYQVITKALTQYMTYLDALYEMVNIYESDKGPNEAFNSLKTYWDLCEKSKL